MTSVGEVSFEELWLDEVQVRDEELETGTVQSVPGPEVFARISQPALRPNRDDVSVRNFPREEVPGILPLLL